MKIDKLLDPSLAGIEKAMDLTWKRNQAITSNIANVETPQYRAVDYNFSTELDRAFNVSDPSNQIKQTSSKHMDLSSESGAHLMPDLSGATKPDGNNVDIDIQMGRLAYNSSKYIQAANLIRKKFQILSNAIRQVG